MPEQPDDSPFAPVDAAVPILRYEPRERPFELAFSDAESIPILEAHIKRRLGEVESVFHEIISDLVHIDVHFIPPTPERNFITLVTTGMSDLPMSAPEGREEYRYLELLVCLPSDWPLRGDAFERNENYWPVYWLKTLARFPHEYSAWLFHDHTMPNGDPPAAFAPDTELCAWWIVNPYKTSEDFHSVRVNDEKTVHFLQIVPLYREELLIKLRQRSEGLIKAIEASGIPEEDLFVITKNRLNVAAKKRGFWPFRR